MSVLSFGRSDPRWLVLILVLSALAVVVLSLAAWFLLPLVDVGGWHPFESEASRLLVILLIVLLWGGTNAVLRARQNSANQARLDALDRQEFERRVEVDAARQGAEAEFAAIRADARHALRLSHGRRLVDILLRRGRALPRYLVIGPPGSGKTTILDSADLTLPYDARANDAAAARACRFVASDRAVFIDVAGDVVLGNGEDREKLWQRLLGLVRSLRRVQPINGVIVVVAAIDLAGLDDEDRTGLARGLRGRLDEISQRLGARVPVYLLLSKLDRVPGFAAFFENLGAEERTQIWAVPLAAAEQTSPTQAASVQFGDGFDDLVRRAAMRQLGFLYSEPDEARRTLAFEFPAQFAAMRNRLASFLDELVRRSRFDEPPMLPGVFLTSALQDGTSIDAIGSVLAPTFALTADGGVLRHVRDTATGPDQARRRPYFLKRLFSDVIVAEPRAGRLTKEERRARHFWSYATRASVALILLVGLIQLWSSYHEVNVYISDVMAASALGHANPDASDGAAGAADFGPKLVALNRLAHVAMAASAPVSSSFDVVQPVRTTAEAAYLRGLSVLLLPSTLHALERLIADPATAAADRFYGLKLYLLLGSGRTPPASLMTELGPTLADDFVGLGKDAASHQQTVEHLVALSMVSLADQPLDRRLVEQARRRLNAATVAEIGYEIMRRRPTLVALKAWRPIDHTSSLGPRAVARASGKPLSAGIPGIFTAEAVGDVGDASAAVGTSLAADGWVLAADPSEQPNLSTRLVQSGILDLYQADYVRAWDALLSDLTVPTLPTASAGAELIAILNGPESPIVQLLSAVVSETNLDNRAEDKILQNLKPPKPSLAVFGSALSRPEVVPLTNATRKAISSQFVGLRDALARPKDGQASEVDAILKGLDPLYRQLLLIGSGVAPPETDATATNMALTMAAINRLPLSIRPYFVRLASDASNLVKVNLRGGAAQLWAESIRPVCEATIAKAFPFDLTARADVPLGEFTKVFSPNGLIATFRRTKLANLVDTSVRPWRWRGSHAAPSDPPDPTLAMFERADAITAAFFTEGDNPGVRFTAVPLRLDPRITRLQLDIGGASLVYAHGPIEPFIGQWPPPVADAPATLSFQPEVDGAVNSLVGTGPWGLFRLIAQASKVAQRPDAMLFAFNMGKRSAALKLSTPTLQNAFDLKRTAGFTCPAF